MRATTFRGAWLLLAVWLALSPAKLRAQGYAPADPQIPLPFGSTRPEDGGLYTSGKYLLYRQTNPLKNQLLAIRGFQASDNSIPTASAPSQPVRVRRFVRIDFGIPAGFTPVLDSNGIPVTQTFVIDDDDFDFFLVEQVIPGGSVTNFPVGTFFGSGAEALNVAQLTGQDTWTPGFTLGVGWKFRDGSSIELSWLYLSEAQYRAGATLAPPVGIGSNGTSLQAIGGANADLSNTFLYAPVFNIPPEFAGANFKIRTGFTPEANGQAAFGIWNAASIMTIEFRQRVQQWELTYREPIFETECYRLNGLVGPRLFWIWEKFKWTTTSIGQDASGTVIDSGPENVGLYTNIVSNRMYGVHAGCQQEFYLGHGFALHTELQGALFLDSVKLRAQYETAAKFANLPQNKHGKREWTIVPEAQASVGIMWYPTEFVQVYAAFEAMGFLNTLASRRPVDFDYQRLSPDWPHMARLFTGFQGGIAFTW